METTEHIAMEYMLFMLCMLFVSSVLTYFMPLLPRPRQRLVVSLNKNGNIVGKGGLYGFSECSRALCQKARHEGQVVG